MTSLKMKRGHIKACITRAADFAENIGEGISQELIEIRLRKLETSWLSFVELHNEILELEDISEFPDLEKEFSEYESKYFLAQSSMTLVIRQQISSKVDSSSPSSETATEKLINQQASFLKNLNNRQSVSVHLPHITIPPFDGDYRKWPSFKDYFISSIDERGNLSATQKFHFLKSFLTGAAAELISGILISENNYLETWDRLERRYDRANIIVQSHVQNFLSLPSISGPNSTLLRKIVDGADETIRGLNSLEANNRDPWLIYLLLQKLDGESKQAWATEVGARDNCTIHELIEFLQRRCDALEACQAPIRINQPRGKTNVIRSHFVSEHKRWCPNCKEDHHISKCPGFLALDCRSRRELVKTRSLCFNCLYPGHSVNRCHCRFRCKICKGRHNSLVHTDVPSSVPEPSDTAPTQHEFHSAIQPVSSNCSSVSTKVRTILPTAVARAQDSQGEFHNIRLLLDSGSQVSFITERTVQQLGLLRKKVHIPVLGVGSSAAGTTNGLVSLRLFSRQNQQFIEVDCFILSKLTSFIPTSPNNNFNIDHLSTYTLADPSFWTPGPIDILIGADKVFSVITGSARLGSEGTPDLIPSLFGWIVSGNVKGLISNESVNSLCTQLETATNFDLERFWKLEEQEVCHDKDSSPEDIKAESIYLKTHSRHTDGRYIVELPFKYEEEFDYGMSLNIARQRFLYMERKFENNAGLKESYQSFMNEYLDLGHMEEVPPHEIELSTSRCFYLPHHAVLKEDSSTTKVRVVFDGSATSNGSRSLNETLLVGPSIQRDLFAICIRFRRHLYTISGDVVKMFRQIWLSSKHTDYQRIVWRNAPNQPLKHYRLRTVTYGTACAPYLAVRTLKQLALDSMTTFPRAANVLLNDFYMDDVMTGADSVEEVISLRLELVELLRSGGFNLRKWTTNCWPLLISLPEGQRELSPREFEEYSSIKLLGLQWSPSKDCFTYKVKPSGRICSTKRSILSESSKIFDPLGFLAPIVIGIKILFQELWRKKYKWDEDISIELSNRWQAIRNELHLIESIQISRVMWKNKDDWQLHGFCDASLDGYAAVVYCRSTDHDGNTNVALVAAKSKVAPLKVISLPRLELCGAVLLSRLINKLKHSLQVKDLKVYAWTDSAIVLHWLSSPPKRWAVFIANRTTEILSSIPRPDWRHVRSLSNPADCATRGILPSHLISKELWWRGPPWLWGEKHQWPVSIISLNEIPYENLEERKVSVNVFSSINNYHEINDIVTNSSSYLKAVRVFAIMLRFISNSRIKKENKEQRRKSSISVSEISAANTKMIQFFQYNSFSLEIETLKKDGQLRPNSKLISLCPFVDCKGILRVGGRIQESELPYSMKHPIILSKSNRLSRLIVEHLHKSYLHSGVSQMFAIVNQTYHILGCRNLVRDVVYKCVKCFRHRKTASSQLMGKLPSERIRYARPFSKVGCDYAGPITLRLARGRNPKFVKAYIALFVCFTTKGIHLELVGDLSSNAFLAALDRFASRRGKPTEVWSDNGTNFHGAKRLLNEMYQLLLSQQHNQIVTDHLSKDNIEWKFIPPFAPHFGGLWEAGVKSVKFHLKRVIGEHKLTYEEMYTMLTKIEALLNSRPMWPTSDLDPIALTPAHFMIGEPYTSIPHPDTVSNNTQSAFNNWYLLQTMTQGFWKRWHREYLTSLQQRPKWQRVQTDLQVDDVVLVKEANLPPSKWLLGRIKEVHTGSDGHNRVVTVKTQHNDYTRPITKIVRLPFSERPACLPGGAGC